MNTAKLCDDCNASGLPILPVRYAPVPAGLPSVPGWASADRVKSVDIGPEFHYGLRILRRGYVYVFFAKNHAGANRWECWAVTEDGHLLKQPDPLMAPTSPPPAVACSRQGHSNARLRHLVIERPDKCGATWIAFSAYKWSEETLKEYASNSKLRNARMQTIHPAAMAGGAKHSHGVVATPGALEQVIEYAPGSPLSVLPFDARVQALSTPDGRFDAGLLKKISTLYAWNLRHGEAQADATAMAERGKKASGPANVPHVLALWDAVGAAHELNGYRNDAAGWVDLYRRERELEMDAANIIDGLQDALTRRAGDVEQSQVDQLKQHAAAWYDPQAAAQQRAQAERLPEPQRSRQLEVCDIVDDWARRQVPMLGYQGRLHQANLLPEPQRSVEIGKIKSEVEQFLRRRETNAHANVQRARALAWPKYEERLLRPALDIFKEQMANLGRQVNQVVEQRTRAVVAWLQAPLFIDTIEDFHTQNIEDGVLFEEVVGDAAFGICTAASGAAKVDQWVKEAKASSKTNLLWRAIALNQQEGIAALDAALEEAKHHLAEQTLASALTWTGYTAKVLKGLADTYKKAQGVYDANEKSLSAAGNVVFGAKISAVNMRGTDRWAIFAGDRVFKAFALDKLGDYASEKIIQHIFTIRTLVNPLDSERFVAEQAKNEDVVRRQLLQRLRKTRTFMKLDTPELRTAQTEALTRAWADFKSGADRVKVGQAVKDARLAVVVGLIEGVNFMKLVADCKMKGDSKSYLSLLASGMTIVSALFDVAATVTKNLPAKASTGLPALGSESWTYQTLKGWGGVLSAGASFIGGILDFVDAGKASAKGYAELTRLYAFKGSAGFVASGLTFAVTFTYAAPLVSRLTGRATIGATIEVVGMRASAVIGLRVLGMALGGWITLGTLILQVAVWQLTPDALQDWLDHSAFGQKRSVDTGGFTTAKAQEQGLLDALVSMGIA